MFKIGTNFIILSKPTMWSSHFSKNCPLESKIKYPYRGKIVDMYRSPGGYISMTDGVYSWSLSCLISENKIISESEYRKLKLKKINNIQ